MALGGLIAPCTISLSMWLLRLTKEPRSAEVQKGWSTIRWVAKAVWSELWEQEGDFLTGKLLKGSGLIQIIPREGRRRCAQLRHLFLIHPFLCSLRTDYLASVHPAPMRTWKQLHHKCRKLPRVERHLEGRAALSWCPK